MSFGSVNTVCDGTGRFEEVGLISGLAYDARRYEMGNMGVNCGDYDNDDHRDIFVACGHLQDNAEKCEDAASYHVQNILYRNTGRGYQSHYGMRLHFGLGTHNTVDRIEVRWIGSGLDVFRGIAVDRIVILVEEGG